MPFTALGGLIQYGKVDHIKTALIHRKYYCLTFYLIGLEVPDEFQANIINFFSEVRRHCKNGRVINLEIARVLTIQILPMRVNFLVAH